MSLYRPGQLLVVTRAGMSFEHVPNQLDCLAGASRPAGKLDGGALDRTLRRWGNGFRAVGVFPARSSLNAVGERHRGYSSLEEEMGLSRTYRVDIGEPEATGQVVEALRQLAGVEKVRRQALVLAPQEAVPPLVRRRLSRDRLWRHHQRVRADEALALEPGDERVRVAVVDTGVSLGHPELRGRLLAGYDTVDLGMGRLSAQVRLVGDSWGRDLNPSDEAGHGTFVAGIIGAWGWRLPPGLAGRALLIPVRGLAAALVAGGEGRSDKLTGVGALSDLDLAVKVAVDLGADVINMSFGTAESAMEPGCGPPHAEVVAYAQRFGCVLVAAAGNSGRKERYYPAADPAVIAVGSVDEHGRRSAFSSYGDHLDLCAPGEGVISAGLRGYKISSGTSFAAPFVAGAAALLVSRARRKGQSVDSARARSLLTRSAAPLGGEDFNPQTGHGLLNVAAALRLMDREPAAAPAGR